MRELSCFWLWTAVATLALLLVILMLGVRAETPRPNVQRLLELHRNNELGISP